MNKSFEDTEFAPGYERKWAGMLKAAEAFSQLYHIEYSKTEDAKKKTVVMRSKMFTIDDNMTIGEFGTMIVLCDELDIIPIETDMTEIRFSVKIKK